MPGWIHEVVRWMHVIQGLGWVGWLLFVGLYAACCIFFIPASVLTVAGGAVYGFWGGCVLVILGNALGSLVCLLVTRYLFRAWALRQLRRHPKMQAVRKAVEREGWKMVLLTRLSPVMPFSLINYALGLTEISALDFLWATSLGSIPATCIYVYIGHLTGNLARIGPELHAHQPLRWTFQGVGLLLTIGVSVYVTRKASAALNQQLKRDAK